MSALDYSLSTLAAAAQEPLVLGRTWTAEVELEDAEGDPVDVTGWALTFALRVPGRLVLRKSGETSTGAPAARVVIADAAGGLVRWRFDPVAEDLAALRSLVEGATALPLEGARGVVRVSLELSARLPAGGGDKRLAGGSLDLVLPLVEAL